MVIFVLGLDSVVLKDELKKTLDSASLELMSNPKDLRSILLKDIQTIKILQVKLQKDTQQTGNFLLLEQQML